MGLFKKKEKKEEIPSLPELPRLPELPEFPEAGKNYSDELPRLPSFPNDYLGDKFSQDTIKKAVAGKKRGEEVADEFAGEEMQRMQRPLAGEMTRDFVPSVKTKEAEPIFIRIDKFEEGSRAFNDVKRNVSEIERKFEYITEEEQKELQSWEKEIRKIKEKMEKIDDNIFSKIE
jgi:predicted transcriptional regulator